MGGSSRGRLLVRPGLGTEGASVGGDSGGGSGGAVAGGGVKLVVGDVEGGVAVVAVVV